MVSKKVVYLSIIVSSLLLNAAPAPAEDDKNQEAKEATQKEAETETEAQTVDLGDIDVVDKKVEKSIKKSIKRRVKSYTPTEPLEVPKTQNSQANSDKESIKLRDISKVEIKSADVAEALSRNTPSVSLIRRSGIANDLTVRGLKKDNISISVDGTKVYGACPNRMDPPLSHVLANNIDYIEIKEGADVSEQGAMGASIKVHTLEPTKEFTGDMNFGIGRWNYTKMSTYLSGGVGNIRFAISLSTEKSGQYQDGDGNNFAQQQDEYIATHPSAAGLAYKEDSRSMDAYQKSTMMGKIYWDITDDQTLKFTYTANRSENVLYPNTPMDADYDNSDIYNLEYEVRNIGLFSDKLTLQYFHSGVDHPMSNEERVSSIAMGVIKHRLTTDVDGAKIKNEFSYYGHNIELGADYSKRNWDGLYYKNDVLFPETLRHSIWDVDTTTVGGYIKDSFKVGAFTWDIGARYDSIEIETPRVGDRDRSFNELSGSLMLHYALNDAWEIFVGGSSGYRVPDGKELYYRNKMGIAIGNEDLNGVRSYEADVGVKYSYGNLTFKLKGFYNYLQDNILYNSTAQTINGAVYGRYENVDSYIYGVEFNGGYRLSDKLLADFSLAWLKGKKDKPLTGQSDTDLPDLPPLRATFGVDYMPTDTLTFRAEVQTSSRWSSIDSDNGEQELAGWGILNLKLKKSFGEHFEVIAGVDNLLDQKYQVSNTYKDLTLITGGDEVMPINEPGRYTYINFRYKF